MATFFCVINFPDGLQQKRGFCEGAGASRRKGVGGRTGRGVCLGDAGQASGDCPEWGGGGVGVVTGTAGSSFLRTAQHSWHLIYLIRGLVRGMGKHGCQGLGLEINA